MGALEPHGPVHELERLRRQRVSVEQVQTRLDPFQGLPAVGNRLLGGLPVEGQPLGGVVDLLLFPVDPCRVGLDERHELGAILRLRGLRQHLHVEDQPGQWREGRIDLGVFGTGRGRPGHFVG